MEVLITIKNANLTIIALALGTLLAACQTVGLHSSVAPNVKIDRRAEVYVRKSPKANVERQKVEAILIDELRAAGYVITSSRLDATYEIAIIIGGRTDEIQTGGLSPVISSTTGTVGTTGFQYETYSLVPTSSTVSVTSRWVILEMFALKSTAPQRPIWEGQVSAAINTFKTYTQDAIRRLVGIIGTDHDSQPFVP